MNRKWTYGQKIGFGYGAVAFIALVMGVMSTYALRRVVDEKDRVTAVFARNLIDASNLESEALRRIANNRAYLLSPESQFLDELHTARKTYSKWADALRKRLVTTEEEQLLSQIEQGVQAQSDAADRLMAQRRTRRSLDDIVKQFQDEVAPRNHEVTVAITKFIELEERQLDQAKRESTETALFMRDIVIGIGLGGIAVALILTLFLTGMLKRQIGSAVQNIERSSNELQAAANQQTTGSKEQSASTNEIATTIKELVATARQIAESAQRVASIAQETARGAQTGDETLQQAQQAVVDIKRQVDLIVNHMLDLGAKSRQIGAILEIINEMSELHFLSFHSIRPRDGAGV